MQNIVKLLVGCVVAAGVILPASAAITLSLSPVSQTVGLGGSATYNVNVSGLKGSADYNGPALGGFNVQVDYNPSVASVQSTSFGNMLNLSGGDYQSADLSAPGQIYLSEISFDSAASLELAQTGNFTLGTITLQGVAFGTSSLVFDTAGTSLSDENGNTLDLISTTSGSMAVVPEPAVYGLASALLVGFCALRRKLTSRC